MTELSDKNSIELEKQYRTASFVFYGQILSVVVLTAIIFLIPVNAESSLDATTRTTLLIAALFAALGTFIIRRLLYRWERLRDTALLKGISGVLQTLTVNSLILGAMAEIVAVIGFVLSYLSGDRFEMVRAAVIALIVLLINFPRKKVWGKIVANLQNV